MNCPVCKDVELRQTLTQNGVLVDVCPKCQGVWLDKGEIFYFTKVPTYLNYKIKEALKNPGPSAKLNPRTQTPLVELSLLGGKLKIDYCPQTQGIWLDKGELEKLPSAKEAGLKIEIDRFTPPKKLSSSGREEVALPNLALASGATLFLLYGFLTLFLIALVNFKVIGAFTALVAGIIFAILQFLLSPFIMDLSLRWFYRARWVSPEELPSHLKEFLERVCLKYHIRFPRVGIIPDGSPNAFTYGHTPGNARIILTSGIMDLLSPEELEAVVAHEVGHIVHWDMLIMTLAYIVPLVLYYIYRTLIRIRTRGRDRSAPYRYALAIASYILYIICEYIILWFSRIREYFADRFSGQVTQNPNSLGQALVKIGYGLAGREEKSKERKEQLEAVKAMGIFDPSSARSLAISSFHPHAMGQDVDKEKLKGAMKWDLWNPWALYYELHSTHPLIAKRLLALGRQAQAMHKEPYIRFDERRPESYWDDFLFDLLIGSLPFLVIIVGAALALINRNYFFLKLAVPFLGGAYLFKTLYSYNFSYFPEFNISSLLKKVKVSGIRPVPCTVEGTIVGRGIPGLVWSEDFVLQDQTGIIFLDYRQPLALWNFLFGLLRAGRYIGEKVKITGWYRRSPVPYIEIKTIETERGRSSCFVFNVKIIWGIILVVAGLALLLFKGL